MSVDLRNINLKGSDLEKQIFLDNKSRIMNSEHEFRVVLII